MKHNSYSHSVLLSIWALIVFVGCSSDTDSASTEVVRQSVHLSAVFCGDQSGSITRTTLSEGTNSSGQPILNDVWTKGDKVYVYNLTAPAPYSEILSADESSAKTSFTGYASCSLGDTLALFYPDISTFENVTGTYQNNDDNMTLNISQQDGKLETIQKRFDFCSGSAKVTSFSGFNAIAEYGVMKNITAIAKFNFIYNGKPLTDITSIKVSDKENLYMQRVFNLRDQVYVDTLDDNKLASNGISFRFAEGVSSYYQVFFPGTMNLTFSIEAGGKIYVGHLAGTFDAGCYYPTEVYCSANSLIGSLPVVSDKIGQLWAKGNLYYKNGAFHVYDNQYEYMILQDMRNGSVADGTNNFFTSTDLFTCGDVGTLLPDGTLGFYNYLVPASIWQNPVYDGGNTAYYHTHPTDYTKKQDMGICGDKRYDICTRALGANWRLPSYYDMYQAINNRGMGYYYAMYFYSTPQDKTAGSVTDGLFLPPSGLRNGNSNNPGAATTAVSTGIAVKGGSAEDYSSSVGNPAAQGHYMTGSLYDINNVWVLRFWWDGHCDYPALQRNYGYAVRCRYVTD